MRTSEVAGFKGKKVVGRMCFGAHFDGVVEEIRAGSARIVSGTSYDWKWIEDIAEMHEVVVDAHAGKPVAKRKAGKREGQ